MGVDKFGINCKKYKNARENGGENTIKTIESIDHIYMNPLLVYHIRENEIIVVRLGTGEVIDQWKVESRYRREHGLSEFSPSGKYLSVLVKNSNNRYEYEFLVYDVPERKILYDSVIRTINLKDIIYSPDEKYVVVRCHEPVIYNIKINQLYHFPNNFQEEIVINNSYIINKDYWCYEIYEN